MADVIPGGLLDNLLVQLNSTGLAQKDQKLYQFLLRLLGGTNQIKDSVIAINSSTSSGGGSSSSVVNNIIQQINLGDSPSDNDSFIIPGIRGDIGNTGATGAVGPIGPAVYLSETIDGEDAFPIPGPVGPTGATGSSNFTQLSQIVTSGSQTTVDFTSISAAYSSLKVLWFGQDTASGTSLSTLRLKVNNDGTAGNYSNSQRAGAEAGVAIVNQVAASTKGVQIGFLPNSGNTSIVSQGEVTLTGYAGTTFHKQIFSTCAEEDSTNGELAIQIATRWRSTSAIDRLTFGTDGTAFTDGSIFTLYGLT